MATLIPGVAASLIAAMIVLLVGRYVWPTVLAAARGGEPDIAGKWMTRDAPGGSTVGEARISQRARKVTIRVTRHTSRQGRSIQRSFTYRGTFRAGQLVAQYEDDAAKYMTGAIILAWSANPDRLDGKAVYCDAGTVVANQFHLARN